jgi:CDP-glycerol glycerophosphotransferase (TagB/SpsB family)
MLKKVRRKAAYIADFVCYWLFSCFPKQKNLWVFTSNRNVDYFDNSKYIYEYIVDNHPEIRAFWLTSDENVYKQLKSAGKPVLRMRTGECRKILSRAQIAVTDHFRVLDYRCFWGYNHGTKIVQLWHGVGLKTYSDGEKLHNTDLPGVVFSDDILPAESDSSWKKVIKKLKYLRHAHSRELFEEYFAILCPGQEHVEHMADALHIPRDRCIMSGHPRNLPMYYSEADQSAPKVLYAPTYRWTADKEQELVDMVIDALHKLQSLMEKINGTFYIRLHPLTWRNYADKFKVALVNVDKVLLDNEKDIYPELGTYSVLISDYSSIAYDFLLLNRPVIFLCYDLDAYRKTQCALNYDYFDYSPGTKTLSWEETITALLEYINDPAKDSDWRKKVINEFYDLSVNDENNSQRIVNEIKKRLGF